MAAAPKSSEQVRDLLQNLEVGAQVQSGNHRERPLIQEGNAAGNIGNASAPTVRHPIPSSNSSLLGMSDSGMYYPTNGYVIPHGFVYDHGGEWDENTHYVGIEGMELLSPGVFSENSSVVYHPTGFSYASQPPYAPFSPVSPMPTMGPDGQLYGPTSFQYGHIYHQPVPPGAQYIPAPSGGMTAELPISASREPAPPGADFSSSGIVAGNNLSLGPRPGVHLAAIPPRGPYPRGVLPVALHSPVPADPRAPFDGLRGFRSGGPSWPDNVRNADRRKVPIAASSRQFGSQSTSSAHLSQNIRPTSPMQVRSSMHQLQNTPAVGASNWSPGMRGRSSTPVPRLFPSLNGYGRAGRGVGTNTNNQIWMGVDKSKLQGMGLLPLYAGIQTLDILKEQNRGPRTARLRTQRQAPGSLSSASEPGESSSEENDVVAIKGQYNQPDSRIDYDEARFFVIKSYSEDDVHKSIKYLVWASTQNGNKRLDAAFQDAQVANARQPGSCPIFLFFSVNASGQFCGVAEMTGPVDFNKSMDFWQQDKWNGWFPVRWDFVKDVPNSQFRHIFLENNDNKPVTNSRDTQEINFNQGIEMLKIFKDYVARTSIVDDFYFYEARERLLRERRGRPDPQLQQHPRLVLRSSGEIERVQISEASNCLSSEKLRDDVASSENLANVPLEEPGAKSLPYTEKCSLSDISSKVASEESITKQDLDSHDQLVSAVANISIQEADDVADTGSSDLHS